MIGLVKAIPMLFKLKTLIGDPWKDDTKGLKGSTTVWFALIPVVVWVAGKFGLELDDAGSQAIIEQIALIVAAIGVILGRIAADMPGGRKVVG